MPSFQVNRLLDFADVTGDWLPIIHSIGPDGDLSILLTDQPNQHERRWDWNREAMPQELAPWGEQFRLIHLPDGVLNSRVRFIDLPPGKRPLHSVLALGLDRWLVIPALLNNYDVPLPYELALSQVIDSCSVVLTELPVGYPWFAEATSDNQIWLGYVGSEDKHFSRYARLEDADLRSLDANGTVLFSLREASMPSQMLPSVDFIYGINIVSEHEVWVAYQSIERYSFEGYAGWLVRIVDRAVVSVWPWSIVSEKAPLLFPKPFAVADGRLLLKGMGDPDETWGPPRCSPHRDDDRLYSVSLTTQRSLEVLPVDERGEWIGPFRTEGRGSRLYLETEHSLYVIDAATLPIQ